MTLKSQDRPEVADRIFIRKANDCAARLSGEQAAARDIALFVAKAMIQLVSLQDNDWPASPVSVPHSVSQRLCRSCMVCCLASLYKVMVGVLRGSSTATSGLQSGKLLLGSCVQLPQRRSSAARVLVSERIGVVQLLREFALYMMNILLPPSLVVVSPRCGWI